MDVRGIRRNNLARLIAEAGGQKALAARAGVSAAYLSQVLSERVRRNVGHNLARRLEEGMSKPYGWMDVLDPAGVSDRVCEVDAPERAYGELSPRRRRLMILVDEVGGVTALARLSGVWVPYLLQVVGEGAVKSVPSGLARHLEERLKRPRGWFDRGLGAASGDCGVGSACGESRMTMGAVRAAES